MSNPEVRLALGGCVGYMFPVGDGATREGSAAIGALSAGIGLLQLGSHAVRPHLASNNPLSGLCV